MKKRMLVSVALGIGAFALSAGMAMAGTAPGSGILNSLHDLSKAHNLKSSTMGMGSQDKLQRVCIYCHAPHHTQKGDSFADANGSAPTDVYLPLWNRPVNVAQTFQMYNNGSNPGFGKHESGAMSTFNSYKRPGFVSLLCLSCHDGSIATNVYGSSKMSNASYNTVDNAWTQDTGSIGAAAYTDNPNGPLAPKGTPTITAEFNIGLNGDLRNHHPIGFRYDIVQHGDDEIAPLTTQFGDTGVKIEDVLYNRQMECVTCHDVHNSTANMGEKFLWTSNQHSAFCCTCHLKCEQKN